MKDIPLDLVNESRIKQLLTASGTEKCLVKYIKDKRNQKIGVLFAYNTPDKVQITWSKCHKPLDKFDKIHGIAYAIERANRQTIDKLPRSMVEPFLFFTLRASRYYKDKPVLIRAKL